MKQNQINVNVEIIKGLSKGMELLEIAASLKTRGITPSSPSSMDKKVKILKKEFKCRTTFQLMYKIGTMGLKKAEEILTASQT